MMWAKEESTVQNILMEVKEGKALSSKLGLSPVPLQIGPWPVEDSLGMQIVIEILQTSQGKGRNDSAYVQFDSIRKLRSSYANVYQVSSVGIEQNLLMKGPCGRNFALTSLPSDSFGFRMFMLGCEKCMGRLVIQELGFTVEFVLEMLSGWDRLLENDIKFKWK